MQGLLGVVPFKGAWLPCTRLVVQGVLSVVPFQGGLVSTYKTCGARSAKCSAF